MSSWERRNFKLWLVLKRKLQAVSNVPQVAKKVIVSSDFPMPLKINICGHCDEKPKCHRSFCKMPSAAHKNFKFLLVVRRKLQALANIPQVAKKIIFSSDFALPSKLHYCSHFDENLTHRFATCSLWNVKISSFYLFWSERYKRLQISPSFKESQFWLSRSHDIKN